MKGPVVVRRSLVVWAVFAVAVAAFGAAGVAPAAASTTVSGQVTLGSAGTPAGAGEVRVSAYRPGGPLVTALTDASGNYTLALDQASYRFEFDYLGTGNFASEWSGNAPIDDMASWITVGATAAVVDANLSDGGAISGHVQLEGPIPEGTEVVVSTTHTWFSGEPQHRQVGTSIPVAPDGSFSAVGLWPGTYTAYLGVPGLFLRGWKGSPWSFLGETITLAPGESRTDIDFAEMNRREVNVTSTCEVCSGGSFSLSTWQVRLEAYNPDSQTWQTVDDTEPWTGSGALPAAQFFVNYPGQYRAFAYITSSNAFGLGYSTEFTVPSSTTTVNLSLRRPQTERIQGPDRFAVAATIAQNFDPGVPVVYVTNGQNFPDALSAGPAAVHQNGLLLIVNPTNIPPVIAAELTRLDPAKIVIVGGPNSVSPAVESQLRAYADQVVRIGGADRYEASRNVARYAFTGGSYEVLLATGRNFPDALSAGGLAALYDAPVITMDGLQHSADAASVTLLNDLNAEHLTIVGGVASFNPGIEYSLSTSVSEFISRASGVDRYAASLQANQGFGTTETVYLAVGTKFPDALTGGPLAAADGAPLILVPPTCVPADVIDFIVTRGATRVVLLGGPASLAPSVASLTRC